MKKPFDILSLPGGHTADPSAEEIRKSFEKRTSISFIGFDSKESAQEFTELFPKYVKLKIGKVSGWGFRQYCPRSWTDPIYEDEGYGIAWHVGFEISKLTEVTGEANEAGNKRIEALIRTLKKHNWIG